MKCKSSKVTVYPTAYCFGLIQQNCYHKSFCLLSFSFTVLYILTGFDNFAEEVGISRDSSLKKEMSLDVEFDEKDQMKVSVYRVPSPAPSLSTQSYYMHKLVCQARKVTVFIWL